MHGITDGEPCASFGAEGPSDDPSIRRRRDRVRRALIATTVLAQGTPMLCAGDEIANSQGGNNNAYNQDNPTGWLDWANADADLRAFTGRCVALRHAEPALRHDRWFVPGPCGEDDCAIVWLAPGGRPMVDGDWHDPAEHAFACQMSPGCGTRLLLLFNPEDHAVPFTLPAYPWQLALDSSGELPEGPVAPHAPLAVPPWSVVVLRSARRHWVPRSMPSAGCRRKMPPSAWSKSPESLIQRWSTRVAGGKSSRRFTARLRMQALSRKSPALCEKVVQTRW